MGQDKIVLCDTDVIIEFYTLNTKDYKFIDGLNLYKPNHPHE